MFPTQPTTTTTVSTPAATPATTTTATPEYLTKEEFNRSAAFIRGISEKLEGLAKSTPTMDMFVSLGLLEKAEDGSYKPKAAASTSAVPAKKDEPNLIADMEARFQSELKKRDDLVADERRKAAETEKRSAIVDALNKAGAVNAARDVIHVSGIAKNAAGKYVQTVKDEFGGDKEVALDEAAVSFLKANPELRKSNGFGGSGTPNTSSFSAGTQVVPREQLANAEWYAKNRDAIMSGQIQVVG
jgi:hypothetical protein